jgi:hypothetical protein
MAPGDRSYKSTIRKADLAMPQQPEREPRKFKKKPKYFESDTSDDESPESPEPPESHQSPEPPESPESSKDVFDDIHNGESIVLDQDLPQGVEGPETGLGPAPHLTEKWYNNPLVTGALRDWHLEIVSLRQHVHLQTLKNFWPRVQSSVSVITSRNFYQSVDWTTLDADTRAMMKTWTPKAEKYMKVKPWGQSILASAFANIRARLLTCGMVPPQ